ncbi:head decoration protein [Ilyobacter polytropus]|uniref:Uncharacterized protein n=1 Tax=Ilyobacter polytropus (strain ATCC 51220 / DSM 2926 / LMG 16218 / CuHBu1) TaxID=572544 RepID=E3HBM3_ILYPC|nr:head decoration protein [Ilyobacter polytropus]ADO83719.1 hypothetical protein Ilyop_1948 [Ilyobacter polytropus DSM 2926]
MNFTTEFKSFMRGNFPAKTVSATIASGQDLEAYTALGINSSNECGIYGSTGFETAYGVTLEAIDATGGSKEVEILKTGAVDVSYIVKDDSVTEKTMVVDFNKQSLFMETV